MHNQVCPIHPDEFIVGLKLNDGNEWSYTCTRNGHVVPGDFSWLSNGDADSGTGMTGLANELNLVIELPAAIGQFPNNWVEYGVVERTYATANPEDFRRLIDLYGHTAIKAKSYTVSSYLAGILGNLSRSGHLGYHAGKATGRWGYLSGVSWWSSSPQTEWIPENRLSWEAIDFTTDYVPGSTED